MIFFIVSPYPKTGSTLLLEIINQHPEAGNNKFLENVPICHMLNGIGELRKNTSHNFFSSFNIYNANWEKYFVKMIEENILQGNRPDYINACKFTWLKYPWLLNYFFPESKILYLIRDPRDSFASYKAMKINRNENPIAVTDWCKSFFNNIYEAESLKNTMYVDYKDVICDFKNTCHQIFSFLNITQLDVDLQDIGSKTFKKRSEQSKLKGVTSSTGICNNRIGRYKTDLDKIEIDYIETKALDHYDTFKKSKRIGANR